MIKMIAFMLCVQCNVMYILRAYCHWLRKIKGGILIYAQAEIPMVSGIKGDHVTRSQYI